MALDKFVGINMPYGMIKNEKGEWAMFNREYLPLGYNEYDIDGSLLTGKYKDLPIFTKYMGLTDDRLEYLGADGEVRRNGSGEIDKVWLYQKFYPTDTTKRWNDYAKRLKMLSELQKL